MSNAEHFIEAVNSENSTTKYFVIKYQNSSFKHIGNPFPLFHVSIKLLSFYFDEFTEPHIKVKTCLSSNQHIRNQTKNLQEQRQIFSWGIVTMNIYQLNQLIRKCRCISKKQSTIN